MDSHPCRESEGYWTHRGDKNPSHVESSRPAVDFQEPVSETCPKLKWAYYQCQQSPWNMSHQRPFHRPESTKHFLIQSKVWNGIFYDIPYGKEDQENPKGKLQPRLACFRNEGDRFWHSCIFMRNSLRHLHHPAWKVSESMVTFQNPRELLEWTTFHRLKSTIEPRQKNQQGRGTLKSFPKASFSYRSKK